MTNFPHPDQFQSRHIGPSPADTKAMLETIGVDKLDTLISQTVPAAIRLTKALDLPEPLTEFDYMQELQQIAAKNKVFRSYIGLGYSGTITPPVILRNVFQNPGCIRSTRRIRQRLRRAVWRVCSISRPWSAT